MIDGLDDGNSLIYMCHGFHLLVIDSSGVIICLLPVAGLYVLRAVCDQFASNGPNADMV